MTTTPEPVSKRPSPVRMAVAVLLVVVVMLVYDWTQPPARLSPADAPDAASLPSENVDGGGRAKASSAYPSVSGEIERLMARLKDDRLSLQDRGNAALDLARMGTLPAVDALREALAEGPSSLRAMIAEALGDCSHPQARLLLLSLLDVPDPRVVHGAIQGVARRGDLESVDVLAAVMRDDTRSESARLAAAEALGTIKDPNALKVLVMALSSTLEADMASHVLEGLGQRSYAEVEELFRLYLDSPDLSSELRVAALEALAGVAGDPSGLLLKQAADTDAEVREEAAWALSATEEPGQAGPQVLDWLRQEEDSAVRRRLYQALGNQAGISAQETLPVVREEASLPTQLAAWQWLASSFQSDPGPEVISYFNETALPALREVALNDANFHHRLEAVMALSRAHTAESQVVLGEIVRLANDERVVRAAEAGK